MGGRKKHRVGSQGITQAGETGNVSKAGVRMEIEETQALAIKADLPLQVSPTMLAQQPAVKKRRTL